MIAARWAVGVLAVLAWLAVFGAGAVVWSTAEPQLMGWVVAAVALATVLTLAWLVLLLTGPRRRRT